MPSLVRAAGCILSRGCERVRHRGDLHRGLEPGPPVPAALRTPERGGHYLPTPPLSAAGVATADQAVSHLRYEFFMPPGFALPIIRPVFIVWLDAWCVLGISVDNNII